ncbi:MAG TPA: 3-deoxy-7-phosphoheptulonate synthase [Anaeromyxobacteraceae bacterium]|nr:3-deoxy-7-phosphoheptulonate synthase [Anaeromyxobacteraceae bacterium]
MIVVMKAGASEAEIEAVTARIVELGLRAHPSRGAQRTIIGVIGGDQRVDASPFEALPGVAECVRVLKPFKLASREFHPRSTVVTIGRGANRVEVGGPVVPVMAGPCAVESWEQLEAVARAAKASGARMLRGGAFKPRSSPYSFQGLGEEGLKLLARARELTGLPIVTEVMSPEAVPLVEEYADCLQIGARNMQNYDLLRAVGKTRKPVMLKRALSGTIEEWLMSAEYVLAAGNADVILCERGIRTYEKATRNTLDLSAVPLLRELSHLPVVVDPSHGTGKRSLVVPMSLAAIAAGADGVIVEVHPHPDRALSDGPQSLTLELLASLMKQAAAVAAAIGRSV